MTFVSTSSVQAQSCAGTRPSRELFCLDSNLVLECRFPAGAQLLCDPTKLFCRGKCLTSNWAAKWRVCLPWCNFSWTGRSKEPLLERWKSQWNWGGQSTKNWVFQMHSINLLWFPCASMGLVGLDTFMQDVSECDSLSGDGDVFDLCLGLKESDTSQVILLYSQRGTTFNHTHTHTHTNVTLK